MLRPLANEKTDFTFLNGVTAEEDFCANLFHRFYIFIPWLILHLHLETTRLLQWTDVLGHVPDETLLIIAYFLRTCQLQLD